MTANPLQRVTRMTIKTGDDKLIATYIADGQDRWRREEEIYEDDDLDDLATGEVEISYVTDLAEEVRDHASLYYTEVDVDGFDDQEVAEAICALVRDVTDTIVVNGLQYDW